MLAGTLTACDSPRPTTLSVGVGFETVSDPDTDWVQIRQQFDDAGVTGFSLSVGRPEWVGFAWEGHEDDWAPAVRRAEEAGRDPLAEAIEALSDDSNRTVTLTLDVLSPATVADYPDAGGAFPDGSPAESFPSAISLHSGRIGEQAVSMCGAVAERYAPDRIALTELLGDTFFSAEDEELFADMTGQEEFPRTGNGDVDLTDPTVADWQSDIVVDLIQRCNDAADVPVEMDARVDWDNPGGDRADSGHRYQDILDSGARLTLWAYTGLADRAPEETGALAAGIQERFTPGEVRDTTISVGLWANGDETLTPEELGAAVAAAAAVEGGPPEVLVTPLSLMTDGHWDALQALDLD